MTLDNLLHETAETIRAIPALSGTPVIEEDKGDVQKELEAKIASCARSVVVRFDGFTPSKQGQGGDLIRYTRVVAVCCEKPSTNRRVVGSPTLMTMAVGIANALQGATGDGATLYLVDITPVRSDRKGRIACDVIFKTTASLKLNQQ